MKSLNELTDYIMRIKPIPADETFTAGEVKDMINLKNAELQTIVESELDELRKLVENSVDDRVTLETIEVVKEYLDMVEEVSQFSEFSNL